MEDRIIKFRQPIRDKQGNFVEWFYWGFIDGQWIQWAIQMNGIDTRKESQQFTNLHDKNGKEIYCGDIVKIGELPISESCIVRFEECSFKPLNLHIVGGFPVEIIGNIYQNQELLTAPSGDKSSV